jgi:hypothetical protein
MSVSLIRERPNRTHLLRWQSTDIPEYYQRIAVLYLRPLRTLTDSEKYSRELSSLHYQINDAASFLAVNADNAHMERACIPAGAGMTAK